MPSNMRVLHNARVLQSCSDDKLYISAGDGRVFEIGGVLLDGESGGSNWDDIPFGEKQVEKVVQEQMVTAREVVVVPANPEYIVVDGVKYDYKRTGYMLSENKEIFGDVSLIKSAYENGSYIVESNTKHGWAMVADALSGIIYFDDDGYHDVHFIEVVTEIVKIDPKYLPEGVGGGFADYYINDSEEHDAYIYADETFTTKVTKAELLEAVMTKQVRLIAQTNKQYKTAVAVVEWNADSAAVDIFDAERNGISTYHTAEWAPME